MANATITIEQKTEMINNNPHEAYQSFVNKRNCEMFNAFRWVATSTIMEKDGCTSFTETTIAGKYALLAMLELGLI